MILRGGNSKIFSGKSLAAILSEIDNLFRNSVAISVNKESKLLYEPALPEPLPKLAIQEGKLLANSFPDKINSMSSTPEHGEINLGESRANSIVIGKQYSTLYFFVVQGCYPMANDNLSSSTDFNYPIVGRYYQNNNMYLLTLQRTAHIATKRNG